MVVMRIICGVRGWSRGGLVWDVISCFLRCHGLFLCRSAVLVASNVRAFARLARLIALPAPAAPAHPCAPRHLHIPVRRRRVTFSCKSQEKVTKEKDTRVARRAWNARSPVLLAPPGLRYSPFHRRYPDSRVLTLFPSCFSLALRFSLILNPTVLINN